MIEMYKKVVFENYANSKGRARRKEYWLFVLCSTIISIVLSIPAFISPNLAFIGNIYSLAVLAPSISVSIRRMHDTNKKWWFIFIPFYNIVLLATEGDKGTNEYGADPKNEPDEMNQIGIE
ncbi:MAG: DUF805 domain-containing protein [Flavobacterium sp.]